MTDTVFVRWQAYLREQVSSANSTFLTYGGAMLGLQIAVLTNADRGIDHPALFIATGVFALLSFACGSGVLVSRLADARSTARVVRTRDTDADRADAERAIADSYGKATWRLLWAQLGTFVIAAVLLVLWAYRAYSERFATTP